MAIFFDRFDGPRGGGRPPQTGGYQQPPHSAPPANGYGPPSLVFVTFTVVSFMDIWYMSIITVQSRALQSAIFHTKSISSGRFFLQHDEPESW